MAKRDRQPDTPSRAVEDYLKQIYKLTQTGDKATT